MSNSQNDKSYSVFLRKSARNCPSCKSLKANKICRYRFVCLCRDSGQFVKDFSTNKVALFHFFAVAHNGRNYVVVADSRAPVPSLNPGFSAENNRSNTTDTAIDI